MKDRVVIHQQKMIGMPVLGRDHSRVRTGRIVKIAIAADDHYVRKFSLYRLRCPVRRAVVYDKDSQVDPRTIDPRQAAKSLKSCFPTIVNRNNSRDPDWSIRWIRVGRRAGHFHAA